MTQAWFAIRTPYMRASSQIMAKAGTTTHMNLKISCSNETDSLWLSHHELILFAWFQLCFLAKTRTFQGFGLELQRRLGSNPPCFIYWYRSKLESHGLDLKRVLFLMCWKDWRCDEAVLRCWLSCSELLDATGSCRCSLIYLNQLPLKNRGRRMQSHCRWQRYPLKESSKRYPWHPFQCFAKLFLLLCPGLRPISLNTLSLSDVRLNILIHTICRSLPQYGLEFVPDSQSGCSQL
jgi:hypothetical protein